MRCFIFFVMSFLIISMPSQVLRAADGDAYVQDEAFFKDVVRQTLKYEKPVKADFETGEHHMHLSTGDWLFLFQKAGKYFYRTNDGSIALSEEKEVLLKGLTLSTDGINDCKQIILYDPETKSTLFYHMPTMDLGGNAAWVLDEFLEQIKTPSNLKGIVVTSTADDLLKTLALLEEKGIQKIALDYGKVISDYSYDAGGVTHYYGEGIRKEDTLLIEDATGVQLHGSGKSVRFNPQTGQLRFGKTE